MAVKKTQMYRKNLDTSETNLYPLTEAQYVSMENGQTVQEVLSDRDSDKYTPVITNSSSTFKVGQGDNVDLSSSMKEGAYDSCVLKGKTMVNCIQEPSSQDVVLPYEFADGQYVTINDTKESGALGVELKGQTLVNEALIEYMNCANYASINGETLTLDLSRQYSLVEISKRNPLVVPNQVYTCILYDVVGDTTNVNFSIQNGSSTKLYLKDVGYKFKFTMGVGNDLTDRLCYIENLVATSGTVSFKMVLLKGDYTSQDIPYFTGMQSVRVPTLSTVGKNLFNKEAFTREKIVLESGALAGSASNGVTDYIRVVKGKTYTKKRSNTIAIYDADKKFIKRTSSMTTYVAEFDGYIRWNIDGYGRTDGYDNNLDLLQIEEGDVVTSYEPYKTSILSLPEEVVLRSLPNGVCDTFNTRTGVYTQRIKEIVFDGSNDEGWNVFTGDWVLENSTVFYTYISGVKGYTWSKYTGKEAISDKIPSYPDNWLRLNDVLGMTNDNTGARKQFRIPKSYLETDNVNGFRKWLEQNPVTACFELATPIITKVNLSSTLKSWNTTTHVYSEIPENTLYPILSHSNPSYPVILKPSTKYSIVANSYSNSHTNSAINFNLGGATASTTVGNRVTTITTPSALSNELLTMSGRGNKLNNVMVIEGDVVGDEPYFEGICDCKSPILSNTGLTLYESPFEKVYGEGASREFFNMMDLAPYVDKWGVNKNYTFSFDIKANKSGTAQIYFQNGSGSRHDFRFTVPVTTEYVRHTVTTRINGTNYNWKESKFACFTTYDTGCFATIKNIQFALGTSVEPYQSNITTFDQKDGKTIVLRSLPSGVCDTLNVETGEYVQRIGEIFFDGTNKQWEVLAYPPHNNNTHYQFKHQLGEGVIGGGLWANAQSILSNTLPSANESLHWGGNGNYGIGGDSNSIMITWKKDVSPFNDIATLNAWLKKNPTIVQYELATPIVSTIDVQGFPYAYTNGHVQLSSGSIEQSLTPKVEYSLSANKTGQINSNTKRVSAHQKQLDDFEAMMLTQMVQSAYDKAILQFDYEMQMMSLGGE